MAVFLRTLVQLPSFSSDLPNTNEDIAPQSQALQAFVLWQEGGGGGRGGEEGHKLRKFAELYQDKVDKPG